MRVPSDRLSRDRAPQTADSGGLGGTGVPRGPRPFRRARRHHHVDSGGKITSVRDVPTHTLFNLRDYLRATSAARQLGLRAPIGGSFTHTETSDPTNLSILDKS